MSSSRRTGKQPPPKRRRTHITASQVDEDVPTPQSQTNAPSASALSTRVLPFYHIPSLTTLCIRVFAENLQELSKDPVVWKNVRLWLKELPDGLIVKVFTVLRRTCPTILSNGFIVAHFLRGHAITLTSDLPGVKRDTLLAISSSPSRNTLRELELSGFEKITDVNFASVVSKLPSLHALILRGCTKVGPKTVEAIVKHCPDLEVINLNYTAVTPISLAPLLHNCKALQVLKVAGIPNWTDATFGKLWSALDVGEDFRLTNLLTLNLRQNALSDAVVNPVLSICPNLRRLDLSFTLVLHPALSLNDNTVLEKLSLTSTKVSGLTLLNIVSHLPNIKILAIGALGGGQGSSAAISNTSAMNMRDQTLRSLTDMLEKCASLERVSLVGNTMLGTTGRQNSAIEDFIRRAGRRCKNLNLAGISSLRSSDLQGLLAEDIHQGAPQIQYLNLNNTMVDDDAAPYIASCSSLNTLQVAGTRLTSAGLFPIIDACTELEKLDLTSCRGVGVVDRRRFFEVWEQDWKNR